MSRIGEQNFIWVRTFTEIERPSVVENVAGQKVSSGHLHNFSTELIPHFGLCTKLQISFRPQIATSLSSLRLKYKSPDTNEMLSSVSSVRIKSFIVIDSHPIASIANRKLIGKSKISLRVSGKFPIVKIETEYLNPLLCLRFRAVLLIKSVSSRR